HAQNPDVIVGDLQEVISWGRVGDIVAYNVGTESCNVGTAELDWIATSPAHPVIGQELYRFKDGRFEQIGVSWLKHAFCALSLTLCSPCTATPCETLGIGCSDPYTAARNGNQGTAGPRSQVNAFNGVFPYPFTAPAAAPVIGRRMQVLADHVDPAMNAGAVYFAEGHYVTPDDAQAGNGENNVSYREVTFDSSPDHEMSLAPGSTTVQESPAIFAWQALDPEVEIVEVRVPGEGLILLGYRVTELPSGSWAYEYAMYNMNSDISARSLEIEIDPSANPENIEFFHVPNHSGEPYSVSGWGSTVGTNSIEWSCPTFAVNENANALRWSRMFNYRFESESPPQTATATVGMFKNTSEVNVTILAPGEPPLASPEDFTCLGSPDGTQLNWTNPAPYTEILINRGSLTVATLAGGETEFFDTGTVEGQSYVYTMFATDGVSTADAVTCIVTIPVFPDFIRGDINQDGGFDISDVIFGLGSLFILGEPQPDCVDSADLNDDGVFDISDGVYGLFSLFVPGSPPIPAPASCDYDPTPDTIDCVSYSPCP
ncbi:MAG: hypothetical protein AAF488_14080, partial [Planctomycetota bacterium]